MQDLDRSNIFLAINLSVSEVEYVINFFNTWTPADIRNNRILKELFRSLSSHLCELVNFSITCGQMTDIWTKYYHNHIFKTQDASIKTVRAMYKFQQSVKYKIQVMVKRGCQHSDVSVY